MLRRNRPFPVITDSMRTEKGRNEATRPVSSYVTIAPDGSREVDVQSLFYDQIEMVRRIARIRNRTGFIAATLRDSEVFKLKQRIAELEAELSVFAAGETGVMRDMENLRAERDRLIDELRDAEARNAQKLSEIERLREALDFYACIDHYPGGAEPYVVPHDYGQKARAALESGDGQD